ncbi:hypothetical protein [uncultured Helicobacter sp.]|uniref:hypothetical protein n=1 Tax=uncultured Helicobacter sp. TaxID=175537 RepID=UPI00374E44FC
MLDSTIVLQFACGKLLSLVGSQISLRLRFATFALPFFRILRFLDSVNVCARSGG